ncbi:MAG: tyrosine-type recombinase/integrase [Acidimicrobiales bacterium]|jgi:site-specific recombinase XerD|nr:tyrosine-type recombinase/integrase [Acidimicrobiales bacterium]
MATRAKKAAGRRPEGVEAEAVLAAYADWLKRQPLATRSREAYLAQVRAFLNWLAGSEHGPQALVDPHVRDWAVRDYKRHVKTAKRWAPASVNQALAAIDNFYRSLAAGRPEVLREELAQVAPRSLEEADQRRFLRIVEASPSPRDRAMATVFFYAGLRLSELAALDMTDVEMSARRGRLKVRTGKGDAYREVPLNSASRKALDDWFEARTDQLAALADAGGEGTTSALWLSRSGTRMTSRAVDLVVRRLATEAKLELSAHVLRHTFVTNLIRSGADVVLVAEIAGHRRLDTTRRYSLPSQADKDAAVEAVLVEI